MSVRQYDNRIRSFGDGLYKLLIQKELLTVKLCKKYHNFTSETALPPPRKTGAAVISVQNSLNSEIIS